MIVKGNSDGYSFINWSKRDTPDTVKQIRQHNAIHARLAAKGTEDAKRAPHPQPSDPWKAIFGGEPPAKDAAGI